MPDHTWPDHTWPEYGAVASAEVTVAYDSTDVARLDALLERANAVLAQAVTDPGGARTAGSASAADGLIQVQVSPGRLESLQMDARALRLGTAELAAEIRNAVNQAFESSAQDSAEAARAAGTALADKVRDIQNDSMRGMSMFVTAMQDAVSRFERDRG
ncbi:hypothetical protein AB0F72_22305 [Actinoplanes sp. NPDC023936]|uniref:hypothetical protein n=1 Tax=Actinoplanes sp. NPDC023936 TaxID=3154910 RepID=UPI0033C8D307